jgi:hypothetical protein
MGKKTMRVPTMTTEAAEAELGPRGHLLISEDNRRTVRKWLVAQGYPAAFAATLTNSELRNAYNETDGTGLAVLRRKLKLATENREVAPDTMQNVAPDTFSLEQAVADVAAVRADCEPATLPPTPPCPPNAPAATPAAPAADSVFGEGYQAKQEQLVKAQALFELMRSIGTLDKDAVESIVESRLSKFRDLLPDFVAACSPVSRIEILRPDATVHRIEGIVHPQFELLVKLATSRDANGYVPGIFIAGEASSGKTTGCKMLFESLGMEWGCNGAISQPHEMLGFIDGNGKYHTTPFRERYEHGGGYTFDEVDRSDANALLAVNPHLAGNVAAFPDGMIKRHKDFILTMTANTWGLGGSSDYAGATRLDAAFLSRAPSRLMWNIDEPFETHICGNESWALRVQAARRRARDAGIKVMICSRMTIAGAAHIANGMTPDQAAACTYLANLKPDQRAIVEG